MFMGGDVNPVKYTVIGVRNAAFHQALEAAIPC